MKLLVAILSLSILLTVASAGYIRSGWSTPVVYSRPVYSGWSGGSGWGSGGSGWSGSGWGKSGWGGSGWGRSGWGGSGWGKSGWGGSGGWSGGSRGWRGGWW